MLVKKNIFSEIELTPRVIGQTNMESGILVQELYKQIVKADILLTTYQTAEICKLVENTYRDVNIAFANEIGIICEKYGIDFRELSRVCNSHPRVNLHQPGPGVGGPCLPKDPYLLLNPVGAERIESNIIVNARKINDNMPYHVLELIKNALKRSNKDLINTAITILGVTYKANVSDSSYSPAEKIIAELLKMGSKVVINDPKTKENFNANKEKDIWKALTKSDIVLVLTDHDEFKNLDLNEIKKVMNNNPILIDTRRMFNNKEAEEIGFEYISIGYYNT